MGLKRTLLISAACLMVSLVAIPSGQAVALSATAPGCSEDNVIGSGLWAGVNIALGTNYGCTDAPSTSSDSSVDTANKSGASASAAAATKRVSYVALGDSVAAGLGLLGASATTSDPACKVTGQAYARLVAESLKMTYKNLACSGATAGDLVTEQHLSGTSRDIEPQLTQAFAGGVPSLISITAGANDVNWHYFIQKCYVSTCGTTTDRVAMAGLLGALRTKLSYATRDISTRSNGRPPRVVLTGYYRPFSAACVQQGSGITATELTWINRQTDALNRVLIDTANAYSYARFAPVNFSGHELCTATPWIQGLQDKAPLHPTYSGQRIISKAVVGQAR